MKTQNVFYLHGGSHLFDTKKNPGKIYKLTFKGKTQKDQKPIMDQVIASLKNDLPAIILEYNKDQIRSKANKTLCSSAKKYFQKGWNALDSKSAQTIFIFGLDLLADRFQDFFKSLIQHANSGHSIYITATSKKQKTKYWGRISEKISTPAHLGHIKFIDEASIYKYLKLKKDYQDQIE
ncbi:MAG: hypothetical protein B7X06_02490 [Verrucomicrobia bacterium 21-51-4]|nr:MAG: hypothetical protein B7X06_02490 [Verrucomicrobia bacterium 21-51-4]